MAPRKQKRQDDIAARPQQTAHTPVAEAIAIGAAAGGLVLGTMQAQGAMPDSRDVVSSPSAHDLPHSDSEGATTQAPSADPVPPELAPAEAAPAADHAETAVPTAMAAPDLVDSGVVANSIPAPVQSQLVSELSEQMTATLVKAIGNAEPGLSPLDLGQSIASDIVASAQQIVANIDIGSLLAQTHSLSEGIVAQLDSAGIIADTLAATSGIADSVLAELNDLPASILGATGAALADLPSSLLGNDGPEGPGGLLSEVFYADGASDSLDIPMLSEVAGSVMGDGSAGGAGLLGLSYMDMPDHQGGHGLNALSLL